MTKLLCSSARISCLLVLLLAVAGCEGRASAPHNLDRSILRRSALAVQIRGGAATASRKQRVSSSPPPPVVVVAKQSDVVTYSDSHIPAGTAGLSQEIFNLIKSIVGAGVLGLPAGIAAFGDSQTALIPALILLVTIGCFAALGFQTVGTVCEKTAATSYKQAWSRSVSPKTAWMPATACLLVTACSVLCYSMILADTIPFILQTVLNLSVSRTAALLGVTGSVILPLCLLRSLSSLAPFSLLGILGIVYTATAMAIRWFTGAYSTGGSGTTTGQFTASIAQQFQPVFGTAGWKAVFSSNSAILISMLSTAYMAHYNAPAFYWELKDRSAARFARVVWPSFAASMALMTVVTAAGFGTFGGASNSLILNNYADTDTLMSFSRAAVTLSLVFSYPLAFVGVREGFLDLASVPDSKRSQGLKDALTVALLAVITALAFVLKDIRVILALGGATWGNLLVYVFPAIMMVHSAAMHEDLKSQVPMAIFTGVLGLLLGVVGTVRAIQSM